MVISRKFIRKKFVKRLVVLAILLLHFAVAFCYCISWSGGSSRAAFVNLKYELFAWSVFLATFAGNILLATSCQKTILRRVYEFIKTIELSSLIQVWLKFFQNNAENSFW